MPQMAPIKWMYLFIMFFLIFIVFNILNYFSYNFNLTNKNIDNKMMNMENKFNWKW